MIPQPDLIRRTGGGWLAVSSSKAKVSIGVFGKTEIDAKENWQAAYIRWLQILDGDRTTKATDG